MKITYTKETTIALFDDNDLPKGIDYKNLFDTVENSRHYINCVDFYYNENGTVCFFKIVDEIEFLETVKLDFRKRTLKLLEAFLNQRQFKDCSIIFYNYRG